LAKLFFGDDFKPEELKSERWKSIGFQGPDPTADFRGAGLFGLENLKYMVQRHPSSLSNLVSRAESKDPTYFFTFCSHGA